MTQSKSDKHKNLRSRFERHSKKRIEKRNKNKSQKLYRGHNFSKTRVTRSRLELSISLAHMLFIVIVPERII